MSIQAITKTIVFGTESLIYSTPGIGLLWQAAAMYKLFWRHHQLLYDANSLPKGGILHLDCLNLADLKYKIEAHYLSVENIKMLRLSVFGSFIRAALSLYAAIHAPSLSLRRTFCILSCLETLSWLGSLAAVKAQEHLECFDLVSKNVRHIAPTLWRDPYRDHPWADLSQEEAEKTQGLEPSLPL